MVCCQFDSHYSLRHSRRQVILYFGMEIVLGDTVYITSPQISFDFCCSLSMEFMVRIISLDIAIEETYVDWTYKVKEPQVIMDQQPRCALKTNKLRCSLRLHNFLDLQWCFLCDCINIFEKNPEEQHVDAKRKWSYMSKFLPLHLLGCLCPVSSRASDF